ncbi:GNAT family N-acetyltransferase [Devosia sp.]|uniref:GNAT family N-acetyltransferase n=1 Tax=Devosia sp. TaxID=1871048 RepID=UPI003A8ED773
MTYALKRVETPADWETLHRLRETVLFAPGRHAGVIYDREHPDDRAPAARPFLLWHDGVPLGTARLDLRPEDAVIRLVAIAPQCQRQGHGRVLDTLLGEHAATAGIRQLWVNAAPEAVLFYERCGWQHATWNPDELTGIAAECVQMGKRL